MRAKTAQNQPRSQFFVKLLIPHRIRVNIHRKSDTPGNFGCPKGVEKKMNFSPKRLTTLNISDTKL